MSEFRWEEPGHNACVLHWQSVKHVLCNGKNGWPVLQSIKIGKNAAGQIHAFKIRFSSEQYWWVYIPVYFNPF